MSDFTIRRAVLKPLLRVFQYDGQERGGLLRIAPLPDGGGVIEGFWLDPLAGEPFAYRPGPAAGVVLRQLMDGGSPPALLHCHPPRVSAAIPDPAVPSSADDAYAHRLMALNGLETLYSFVVAGQLYGYRYTGGKERTAIRIRIADGTHKTP